MKVKTVILSDGDEIDLMSFLDEFGIPIGEFDLRRLKIEYDEDWSGCYYAGERPTVSLVMEYE